MSFLTAVKFDNNGLIPVITQNYADNEILMFAFMNKQALELTYQTKQAVYFSRSRNRLWVKGEESGHIQKVKEIFTDCDKDVILIKVEQIKDIACHTGRKSCFFNELIENSWIEKNNILKNPKDIYG